MCSKNIHANFNNHSPFPLYLCLLPIFFIYDTLYYIYLWFTIYVLCLRNHSDILSLFYKSFFTPSIEQKIVFQQKKYIDASFSQSSFLILTYTIAVYFFIQILSINLFLKIIFFTIKCNRPCPLKGTCVYFILIKLQVNWRQWNHCHFQTSLYFQRRNYCAPNTAISGLLLCTRFSIQSYEKLIKQCLIRYIERAQQYMIYDPPYKMV